MAIKWNFHVPGQSTFGSVTGGERQGRVLAFMLLLVHGQWAERNVAQCGKRLSHKELRT